MSKKEYQILPRKSGICKGEVEISNDFDDLLPELLSKFYDNFKLVNNY